MKTYKRHLAGMNSIQKLIVNAGKFHRIENIDLGAGRTLGFCPNEFAVGKPVPHGFYTRFGFREYNESENEKNFQDYSEGNFTGKF